MITRVEFKWLMDAFAKEVAKKNGIIADVLKSLGNGHSVPEFLTEIEDTFLSTMAAALSPEGSDEDHKVSLEILQHSYFEDCDLDTGRLRESKMWASGADGEEYEFTIKDWGDVYDMIVDWNAYFRKHTGVAPAQTTDGNKS